MGVMSCNRKSCENIMCDTYISQVGYICNDCQSEFQEQNGGNYSHRRLIKKLEKFMCEEKLYKKEQYNEDLTANDLFRNNTID